MRNKLFDKFTYLHFAVGIICYFFNITLSNSIFLHTIFEIIENTEYGVYFIDNYLLFWPGGKQKADPLINSIGDTIGFIFGWITALFIAQL